MKQKVIIKSNKYGLIVHMDPDAEYTEILKELREKFLRDSTLKWWVTVLQRKPRT